MQRYENGETRMWRRRSHGSRRTQRLVVRVHAGPRSVRSSSPRRDDGNAESRICTVHADAYRTLIDASATADGADVLARKYASHGIRRIWSVA